MSGWLAGLLGFAAGFLLGGELAVRLYIYRILKWLEEEMRSWRE